MSRSLRHFSLCFYWISYFILVPRVKNCFSESERYFSILNLFIWNLGWKKTISKSLNWLLDEREMASEIRFHGSLSVRRVNLVYIIIKSYIFLMNNPSKISVSQNLPVKSSHSSFCVYFLEEKRVIKSTSQPCAYL